MRRTMLLLLLLLLIPLVLAPEGEIPTESPLTNPTFSWISDMNDSTLGLPWYPVQPWEIDVCTRGLSTLIGADPTVNNVVDISISTPIYRDTITLLAKKTYYDFGEEDAYYYELGWYVQPYEGDYEAKITLYDTLGQNYTVDEGPATDDRAFDGYEAFPVPCDPEVYDCIPLRGDIMRARLQWRYTLENNSAEWQYMVTEFVEVNATE